MKQELHCPQLIELIRPHLSDEYECSEVRFTLRGCERITKNLRGRRSRRIAQVGQQYAKRRKIARLVTFTSAGRRRCLAKVRKVQR